MTILSSNEQSSFTLEKLFWFFITIVKFPTLASRFFITLAKFPTLASRWSGNSPHMPFMPCINKSCAFSLIPKSSSASSSPLHAKMNYSASLYQNSRSNLTKILKNRTRRNRKLLPIEILKNLLPSSHAKFENIL